jgi:competence protein ComEA
MSLSRRDWTAAALGLAGGVAIIVGAWLAIATLMRGSTEAAEQQASVAGTFLESPAGSPDVPSADLVVDVQGAVKHPGVVLLPPGSRVADALQAAGGYSSKADLNAAAASLNLAAELADGSQVYVPVIGIAAQPGGTGGGGGGASAGSGLVNLNTATPEELEALPGIGPVTVQKIVAARAEQPFASLDELVARDVLNRGQLDDVRDLVTL